MAESNHERFVYSPENLAKGLSQVSSDIVDTPSAQLLVKWYRSAYVDIQLWENQKINKVIRQQFSFLGVVVEWNHLQGIKTGMVEDFKSELNKKTWSVKIIYDQAPVAQSLDQAIEVIGFCEALPEREVVLSNFRNNPKLTRIESLVLIFKHLFFRKK